MYKRYFYACIMLLLIGQMFGCTYGGENETVELDMQWDSKEMEESEEWKVYTSILQDIFNKQVTNLSENIYLYQDRLYIDTGQTYVEHVFGESQDGYIRLVFGKWKDQIVLLDLLELPSTWDKKTVGTNNYLVSGDKSQQVLWIYDLNSGDVEKIQVRDNQTICCWDVGNGKAFYGVKTQNTDTDIINEIVIRDLNGEKEEIITFDEQFERIHQMSVNDKGEIGIFYWNVNSVEDHLGIIKGGQLKEVDTSNVEIWNLGRNELHEFQLLDDKFMICTEDIGHTLIPWNRSYEVFFDGNWKDIPCEQNKNNVLGYVDDFFYMDDYYLVYWSPWTMSGGFGADIVQNAKVQLYTMDGKCCEDIDIPESNLLQTSVYFMGSDETAYVISVSGKDYKICVQDIPLK